MKPDLSIIIPTHKRASILAQCLGHIERQTIRDQLEVIVVSDGEDQKTAGLCEAHAFTFPLTYTSIPKSQQGIARNRGVDLATAPRVLFIGDDIFLMPDACARHVAPLRGKTNQQTSANNQNNIAILGFTTWDPSLDNTPVMRWLESSGWQFGYPMIEQYAHDYIPSDKQYSFTYTSHISLPTAIAKQIRFREDVSLYGWEDMEWGMRLKEAGIRLFYEPDAKAFHHHPMTLEQSLKRMETLGKSAMLMEQINPDLHLVPKGLKRFAYELVRLLPTMRGRHARAFLRGIAKLLYC
jgi:glycosyltransferase involved in cell wall biosynthesis